MDRRRAKSGRDWRIRPALSLAMGAAAGALLIGLCAGICAAQGTATTTTTTTTTTQSSEPAFIKNLHITGYFQNTSATWVNSSAMEYNTDRFGKLNRNSLASERNLLQVDVNDDFTENDSMFLRAWFDYEPSYPWETGCLSSQLSQTSIFRPVTGVKMDCSSDFYNEYGIREMWFKHRWGPLQFFIGKQIVTWGESLAFRVGDQINPQDLSYAFGFTNLEQSRVPLWMLHPILNLPSVGPLSSNFAELVYIPGVDFLYTQVDSPGDPFEGLNSIAGRVTINAENPGGRFAGRGDTRTFRLRRRHQKLRRRSPRCRRVACGSLPEPLSIGEASDQSFPNATWGNSQIGIRLHTLVENAEVTAFYLWNHDYQPVARINNRVIFMYRYQESPAIHFSVAGLISSIRSTKPSALP